MKMICGPRTVALLLVTLIAAVMSGVAIAAPDERVEALFTQQEAYFQTIQSLQFSAKITRTANEALRLKQRHPSGYSEFDVSFCYDRDKFRSQVQFTDASDGIRVMRTMAYDGSEYQVLEDKEGKRSLVVGRNSEMTLLPDAAAQPLLIPFAFADSGGTTPKLQSMKAHATWSDLAQFVISIEAGKMLGHDGYTVKLKKSMWCGKTIDATIFFASDLGDFPVYSEYSCAEGRSFCSVLATQRMASEIGTVTIPLTIEAHDVSADGTLGSQLRIDLSPISLRLNEPTDQSKFALPRDDAKVWQSDIHAWVK